MAPVNDHAAVPAVSFSGSDTSAMSTGPAYPDNSPI
jgi:hypothetical protein